MSKIKDYKDAESSAMRWVRDRYPGMKRAKFRKIWKEMDVWTVDGEVEVKTGVFATTTKSFKLQLSAETGEVVGYSE